MLIINLLLEFSEKAESLLRFDLFFPLSGGSSAILQKILGHTTQSTTQLYIHLAGSDVKEWHNRFSPGDRVGR